MSGRVAALAFVLAAAVPAAGCSDPPRFETPAAVFDSLPDSLEFTALTDLEEDDQAALALMSLNLEASEDSMLGLLDLEPDGVDECAFTAAAAFAPIPGEVDDLDSLTAAAAAWSGKEVVDFEQVQGIDGRLKPGSEEGCAEAVLAADLGDVYVFALGHPDVVDRLVDHLRD